MAIAGYKLKINGGAFSDFVIDVGDVTNHFFASLDEGTEYSVEVESYTDDSPALESAWSAAQTLRMPGLAMVVDSLGNSIVDASGNAYTVFV